ncbi:hypothetical protein [Bacteroides thetaiotaomicron]|uniref:hypothetical protein n=1 Tax=Bacteroides thetaiotaomicron TaxID=818 RepID=UPI001F5BB6C0|nr:hypothetical protein [Bacteroides thetaiotaomicron]
MQEFSLMIAMEKGKAALVSYMNVFTQNGKETIRYHIRRTFDLMNRISLKIFI